MIPVKINITLPNYPDTDTIGEVRYDTPQGIPYCTYVRQKEVIDLLEKLRVVCGKNAMRYVEKRIEELKR